MRPRHDRFGEVLKGAARNFLQMNARRHALTPRGKRGKGNIDGNGAE